MRAVFTSIARQEMDDAVAYYESQAAGLGRRFRREVRLAVGRILTYPQAWPRERGEIRKCVVLRFPYKLLYALEPGHVVIVAVAHTHRHPDYWVDKT